VPAIRLGKPDVGSAVRQGARAVRHTTERAPFALSVPARELEDQPVGPLRGASCRRQTAITRALGPEVRRERADLARAACRVEEAAAALGVRRDYFDEHIAHEVRSVQQPAAEAGQDFVPVS
jgi:hypothetical protein